MIFSNKTYLLPAALIALLATGLLACSGSEATLPGLPAWGTHHAAPDADVHGSFPSLLAALVVFLAAGKMGGELFSRLRQPAVLGELIAGIILGNLILVNAGWSWFEPLRSGSVSGWANVIDNLAQIGVILLIFEVGLESTVGDMLNVGVSSTMVALAGVVGPMILGYGVSTLFIHEVPKSILAVAPGFSLSNIHLFVGAILSATSVGITARVFRDLGAAQLPEARIVLGAAVIDDVLGLIILGVVSGIITAAETGSSMGATDIIAIASIAMIFLVGSILIGSLVVPRIISLLARLHSTGMMVISAVLFCFLLSYLASLAGLAPIVGAFAAGLILEPAHFRVFGEEIGISETLRPVTTLLVPVFFIYMGIQVRLETFADLHVLGIGIMLTLAAIAGKQVCGWATTRKGLRRSIIGIGMIPRGEVGLIFAGIGRQLRVLDDSLFSAIVIMVVLTTLITPPLLRAVIGPKPR